MELVTPKEDFDKMRGTDLVTLRCKICKAEFSKQRRRIYKDKPHLFCSRACMGKDQAIPKEIYKCENCSNTVEKLASEVRRYGAFCSKTCQSEVRLKEGLATKGKTYRGGQAICSCGLRMSKFRTYCVKCAGDRPDEITNRTLGQLKEEFSGSVGFAVMVRTNFRKINSHLKPSGCQICGYSKHVEYCHIKAIKDFPLDTLVCEVNKSSNLAFLCPNCHWEFDHGLLEL